MCLSLKEIGSKEMWKKFPIGASKSHVAVENNQPAVVAAVASDIVSSFGIAC